MGYRLRLLRRVFRTNLARSRAQLRKQPTATLELDLGRFGAVRATVLLTELQLYLRELTACPTAHDARMTTWRALANWFPFMISHSWLGTPAQRFLRLDAATRDHVVSLLRAAATEALATVPLPSIWLDPGETHE